MKGGGHWKK